MIEFKHDITHAIISLFPNGADYIQEGDEYENLNWKDKVIVKPTREEIDAELTRLREEHSAQAYARNRKAEYPSIESLIVGLYDTDDKSAIEAKRAAVKLKYPKPA